MRLLLLFTIFFFSLQFAQNEIFEFKTSEKLEAFFLLDLLTEENLLTPEFHGFWQKMKTPEVEKAVQCWQNRGKELAQFFSPIKTEALSGIIALLQNGEPFLAQLEPYASSKENFQYLQQHHQELLIYLKALQTNDFNSFWLEYFAKDLQAAIRAAQEEFVSLQSETFWKNLAWFLPSTNKIVKSETTKIYLYFVICTPKDCILGKNSFEVAFTASEPKSFLKRWLCKNSENLLVDAEFLQNVQKIAKKDSTYSKAYSRIYQTKDLSIEYKLAACLYLAFQANLVTKREALFQIKMAYPDSEDPFNHGAPLTALLFQKLMQTPLFNYLNYNHFLEDLFQTQAIPVGYIQENVDEILAEVLGFSGLLLQENKGSFEILSVWNDTFAKRTGLQTGDHLLKVNDVSLKGKSLHEVLDLLAGYKGEEKVLEIEREAQILIQRVFLH